MIRCNRLILSVEPAMENVKHKIISDVFTQHRAINSPLQATSVAGQIMLPTEQLQTEQK